MTETGAAASGFGVVAVRYATLRAPRSHFFYNYAAYGEPDAEVEMAYYFWVLEREGQTILVDTGFDPAVGARRGRTCLCPPLEALARLGIEPESVSTVVVTHFHYDHIGNLDAFPHAQLVVPRRELEFWTGPLATRPQLAAPVEAAEIAYIAEANADGRVRLTSGTEEILDGVTAIDVGGHSPGQQVTVVAGAGGVSVVLASDAVHFFEEVERDRPFGVIVDLPEMYRAYDLLNELASVPGAVLVPGHDPAVLDRFPPVEGADGLAVRLA